MAARAHARPSNGRAVCPQDGRRCRSRRSSCSAGSSARKRPWTPVSSPFGQWTENALICPGIPRLSARPAGKAGRGSSREDSRRAGSGPRAFCRRVFDLCPAPGVGLFARIRAENARPLSRRISVKRPSPSRRHSTRQPRLDSHESPPSRSSHRAFRLAATLSWVLRTTLGSIRSDRPAEATQPQRAGFTADGAAPFSEAARGAAPSHIRTCVRRSCLAAPFRGSASCAGNNRSEVQPVSGALAGAVRFESARPPLNQPESTDVVTASGVRQADTKLRESLPQVPLLSWTSLPARLEDLMRGKGPALLYKLSRDLQRLHGRQGLLRHRLDTHSPIGQRATQCIPRPSLPGATHWVTITGHSRLLPERPNLESNTPAAHRRSCIQRPSTHREVP